MKEEKVRLEKRREGKLRGKEKEVGEENKENWKKKEEVEKELYCNKNNLFREPRSLHAVPGPTPRTVLEPGAI